MTLRLVDVLATLERHYGRPPPPRITDPWHMILHENATYLVDDERRDEVFESLRKEIGLRPRDLLKADLADIAAAIARGGMQPDRRAQKLLDAAEIITEEFDGDLQTVLTLPEPAARKALRKFPGIGDPGADKVFLFTRTHPILALESNGLRVLVRLGLASESTNYAAMYRVAQAAAAAQLPRDFDALISAHQILRQHGRTTCLRSAARPGKCPLEGSCCSASPSSTPSPGRGRRSA